MGSAMLQLEMHGARCAVCNNSLALICHLLKLLGAHGSPAAGIGGAIIPGSLCASLFPAIIGSAFPGALYLSQTLKFRNPALVSLPAALQPHPQCTTGCCITFFAHWMLLAVHSVFPASPSG